MDDTYSEFDFDALRYVESCSAPQDIGLGYIGLDH